MRKLFATLLAALILWPVMAAAQSTVQQVGPVVAQHPAVWVQNGQVGDSNLFPFWLSGQLDSNFGSTPGSIICRGPDGWVTLTPGMNGQYLVTSGVGSCPNWTTASPGGVVQSGNVTANNCAQWVGANTISDAGAACGGAVITRAQISTTLIGANKTVTTTGFSTPGDVGAGAIYTSVGATSTGWMAIQDAGGTWFNLVNSTTSNAGWFGAKGDGGVSVITAQDITNNPGWRGCYVVGDTWDTVGVNESALFAHATNSTPCVSGVTHFVWNITSGRTNLTWVVPNASGGGGAYGINEQIFINGTGVNWMFGNSRGACLSWKGVYSTAPLKTDSVLYGQISNICLINNIRAPTPGSGAAIWIMDHDGSAPGGGSTNQLIISNGFFSPNGLNEQGISINPVGGSSAQGSTIVFLNDEFNCGAGTDYGVRANGSNAISIVLMYGDMIGCTRHGMEAVGGSAMDAIGNTQESQDLNGYFFAPRHNQYTRGGYDFYSTGGVTSNTSRFNQSRSEGENPVYCVANCVNQMGLEAAQADLGAWGANAETLMGSVVTSSSTAPGHVFILASTGANITNGSTAQGWRDSATTSNACHIDDNGSPGWTTNQWVGYSGFWRFTNGVAVHLAHMRWNSAGTASWCTQTNAQVSGTTLTVNSVTAGGNTIQVGDTLIGAGLPTSAPYVTVVNQTGGTTGGAGTYTISSAPGTISAETIEIGPVSGLTVAPPGNEQYTFIGIGGSSTPSFAGVTGASIIGQADGGNSGWGCTFTQGSTSVTCSGGTIASSMVNGNWIMWPNASSVGNPTPPTCGGSQCSASLATAFFAQLSGCGGGTCTMSFPADQSGTFVTAYISPGIADGQLTWMDLDYNAISGLRSMGDVRLNYGRVNNVGRYGNVSLQRPDWNRGGIISSAFSPNYNSVTGFSDRQATSCSWSASTTWPTGTTNDQTCTISVDGTLNAPPTTANRGAYLTLNTISSGAPHVVTFGTGFVIPSSFTSTWTTSGVASAEKSFLFVEDGTNGWVEVAGPNGVANGTVTTTGSPASGNLAKFSGASSIVNGDLSGDCTTSGTLAITCTKTNGAPIAEVQLGKLIGANFNSTADQTIALSATGTFVVTRFVVTNASTSLTAAQGAFYFGASKTSIFSNMSATFAYTPLTTAAAAMTMSTSSNVALASTSFKCTTSCNAFLSLTTPQGGAATADVYVYGVLLQ